jgi:hypothetical protein
MPRPGPRLACPRAGSEIRYHYDISCYRVHLTEVAEMAVQTQGRGDPRGSASRGSGCRASGPARDRVPGVVGVWRAGPGAQRRDRPGGDRRVHIIEYRLTRLSYAAEIAQAMLRQQANAVVGARQRACCCGSTRPFMMPWPGGPRTSCAAPTPRSSSCCARRWPRPAGCRRAPGRCGGQAGRRPRVDRINSTTVEFTSR